VKFLWAIKLYHGATMNDRRDYRYLIYLLFIFSGVSGLIYQIVWTRLLVLVFGNTMMATSTVLSAFMGGLAAGSYVLGKYIDRRPRPLLKVYAALEAGIGLFAVVFPLALDIATPMYAGLYTALEGNIVLLNLFRFAVCFVLIGLPTFLMGGTLPVLIKRFTGSDDSIGYQTGFLYGLNTVGAVIGTFACGYFMLRLLGMQKTTWVAVAINLAVAVVAWYLGRTASESADSSKAVTSPANDDFEEASIYGKATIRMVLIGIGLSGFCALAYEVFWTRMLNLFLHNNVYSFTAILATFLIGIATGSLIYARFLSKIKQQIGLFIWLQIGIAVISYSTPYIFRILHSTLFNNFSEALTLAKTAVIMIGPTIMMGVAVPLAIQICRRGANREGTSVGTVYAANTVGAIIGAFAAGFILLPTVGLHLGVIIVAGLNLLAGFLPLMSGARKKLRPAWGAGYAVIILVMFLSAPPDLFKSLFQNAHPNADIMFYKEGKVANVLVYDFKKLGYKDFHLNAVNEASSRLWHVQLFKMLGLLPALVHENPTDALMVAFGAGMSAGATARVVQSLDCVDLNPDIGGIAEAFTRENLDVINQPNFHKIVNDGRNALLLNPRKYSLIISDATNPKMFDSWTLYSQEFYQLVKDRLEPNGVFCQWALIPLPGDAIKVILNTFRSVFPHMSFWVIHGSTQVLMLGTPERLEIDYNELSKRLEPLYEDAGLAEFGVDTPEKFLSFFMLGEDGLAELLDGFDKISTDDMPHAQFHVEQDPEGINNCLDLVKYRKSILPYMKRSESLPAAFESTMAAYADIAARLDVGFLKSDRLMYAEAAVISDDAGLNDANVAHMLNHCPEKKRYFRERIGLYPDDVTARNWLGNIYLLDGEFDSAKQEFEKTIALKPDHTFARMNLALTNLETGRLDEAVAGFLEVRKLCPTKSILNSIEVQLKKIRILRKLQYQPNSVELLRELGLAYYSEGEISKAVHTYREAAKLNPGNETILYDLARICENHGFIEEAARIYGQLAATQSQFSFKNDQYHNLLQDTTLLRQWRNNRFGTVPLKIEKDTDAQTHPASCDKALALWNDVDPDGAADMDKLREAAELYEQSTKTKPDDLHAYLDAAMLYEAVGDFDHAADLWTQASQIATDQPVYRMQAGRLQTLAALKSDNLNDSEKAALLKKVGDLYRGINQPEQALEYFHQSTAADSSQAESWLSLAETATEVGLYREAISAADKALTLQPSLESAKHIKSMLDMIVKRSSIR